MEMKDLVCAVTGSGKGLGKAIAEKFFQEGAKVVLWDRSGLAKEVMASLDPSGERTLYVRADVREEEQVMQAAAQIAAKFGRIDVLVNNAGISRHKPLAEMTVDLWDEVIDTNLKGVFLCCKAISPYMKEQKRGKIVNIASLGGRTGRPGVGVNYAASKAGVVGITQLLAKELGACGDLRQRHSPGPDPHGADEAIPSGCLRDLERRPGGSQGRPAGGCGGPGCFSGFPAFGLGHGYDRRY